MFIFHAHCIRKVKTKGEVSVDPEYFQKLAPQMEDVERVSNDANILSCCSVGGIACRVLLNESRRHRHGTVAMEFQVSRNRVGLNDNN